MRTLLIGDIHGNWKALQQVLTLAGYDPDEDRLICVGDYVDGWPESREVVNFLSRVPHGVFIRGNHDVWFYEWLLYDRKRPEWVSQGGQATLQSYEYGKDNVSKERALVFMSETKLYHVEDNKLFVHGGYMPEFDIDAQPEEWLLWNRDLWYNAENDYWQSLIKYDHVYIGHTQTQKDRMTFGKVTNLDTGAGWYGVLTVQDLDTGQRWHSEPAPQLYPEAIGRG